MAFARGLCLLIGLTGLTGCGQDSLPPPESGAPPIKARTRPGASANHHLASAVDGEAIAFTVHEPDTFIEGARYPLLIEAHGYTGSRVRAEDREAVAGVFSRLLEAGYGIISVDQRGHGDSGGQARVLDPDFEGRDLLQILDWAEAELPWLSYRGGNLVLGAFGESYGGGSALLIHRLDPKHRLDAIVPDVTWHDLRHSFFEGRAFKSTFAVGFNALALQTGTRQHPDVTQLLLSGVATNDLSESQQAFFLRASPAAACMSGELPPVDALITQSAGDALFNFNEGHANYECLRALGGDVRLWVKPAGHGVSVDGLLPVPTSTGVGAGPSGNSQNCGRRDRIEAVQAWFDDKLKGRADAARRIPRICAHLGQDGEDAIVLESVAIGSSAPFTVPAQTLLLQDGTDDEIAVPLYAVQEDGEVFGGIPAVELALLDPLLGEAGAGDPILFTGFAVQREGVVTPLNQLAPLRGYGTHDVELPGAFERLRAGDQVLLRLRSGAVFNYAGTGSRTPTPVVVHGSVRLPLLGVRPSAPQ